MTEQDLQDMIDGMNARMQKERGQTQMTLGALIQQLEELTTLDPTVRIAGLGELMSYRGYYCDLAFEPSESDEAATDLLARCRAALGAVFEGYKGGDFQMGATTPLWVAEYGEGSSPRLMGLDTTKRPVVAVTETEPL